MFQFRNTGRTPAKGAWIDAIIKRNARRLDIDVYRELAAIARNKPLDFGYTIFPENDMIQEYTSLCISRSDLDACFNEINADGWSEQIAIQPVLIGCLDYGLSFENERHQTGFILQTKSIGCLTRRGSSPSGQLSGISHRNS